MPFAKEPSTSVQPPIQLIRLALIGGVLLFGAVILIVHRQASWTPTVLPSAVRFALLTYAIVAIVVTRVMRGRIAREPNPQRRASLLIAAWGIGEAAALFGGVLFLLTGESQWYLLGLAVMAVSFARLRT